MDLSVASNWFTVFRKVILKDAFTFIRVLQRVKYYHLAKHGCKESPASLTRTLYPQWLGRVVGGQEAAVSALVAPGGWRR